MYVVNPLHLHLQNTVKQLYLQVQLCLVKAIFNVTEATHRQNIRQDQNIFCIDQVKIQIHTPPPPTTTILQSWKLKSD